MNALKRVLVIDAASALRTPPIPLREE